jgi:DNA-directed RNA polymerase specialized sigma24 family protein
MARSDQTSIGGMRESFQTTDWAHLHGLCANDLVSRYWKPVYCYLRTKGCDNEKAKDLTQGFFHEIVIGRELAAQADRAKGKFRTFLLTALNRYVISAHRAAHARKRSPENNLISIDDLETEGLATPVETTSPDEAFHYAWASQILDQVLEDVEQECRRDDRHLHWEVFRRRVLDPIMGSDPAPGLDDLCVELGIEQKQQATNMVVTVKRRFQAALRRRVRQFVTVDAEVDAEIHDLIKAFARGAQEADQTDV